MIFDLKKLGEVLLKIDGGIRLKFNRTILFKNKLSRKL